MRAPPVKSCFVTPMKTYENYGTIPKKNINHKVIAVMFTNFAISYISYKSHKIR